MKLLKEYDRESILAEEVFTEIFDEEDLIMQARMILSLTDRAKELGVKAKFEKMIAAYKQVKKDMKRQQKEKAVTSLNNWTDFSNSKYKRMYCGAWVATDSGVYAQNFMSPNDIVACYHPILPVERLKNMETGEEQILLAYKRNNHWNEIKVAKDVISSANKIISLSKYGISVTSENAKHLVKYLSDVENMNDDQINIQMSTAKLGWHGDAFIPYDTNIIFDGDNQFQHIYDAVHERGSEDVWLDHVRKIRKSGRIEAKFMLAASFASILVSVLDVLPFFVDIWGVSGGGKSVSLMLACSVWANPEEHQYIGDFDSTNVGWEVKADMLNHLPMILDDTNKANDKVKDNLEALVYSLCSGKGKSRSNKDLGIRRENRWKNCILTNGERPLQSYASQGGAINRVLELECLEGVYENPSETIRVLKKNYGFAGKRFVEIVKAMDDDSIRSVYEDFNKKLFDENKTQKQTMSLATILTADKIATEYIFKDKCYIPLDEAKQTLVDQNIMSDNERCYRYLLDKIAMNPMRFDMQVNVERWGIIDKGYAIFYNQAFDDLCQSGGFSKKSFLSWADRKSLLQMQNGKFTKLKKINGTTNRCVWLKLDDGMEVDSDGFIHLSEEVQEELPFS